METTWFCLVAAMLAVYVVLDGFDLGAGVAHLLVASTDEERRTVLRTIGPVWDGNEVWLLAAGGTLYFAFPALYASSFSGFYLPLMIVLWLLILRGLSIELRNHIDSPVWHPMWDVVFAGASALLAIFFGAALGNVVRGVPLDKAGEFFLPLWTDFSAGHDAGILDWYTVLVAVSALLVLTVHGALWLALKTEGAVHMRSRALASIAWWGVLVSVIAITLVSFVIQPHLARSFAAHKWMYVFPVLALLGLAGIKIMNGAGRALEAFRSSCAFLAGMLTSVAAGLYPWVLPASGDPALSLTIYNAAAPRYGLQAGMVWFIPGMALTAGYFIYTYRSFAGKVTSNGGETH
jgi:cytochrome bd ubiquinol oxidase subunit II